MPTRAKRFTYAIRLDRAGRLFVDDGAPLTLDEAWTPDDLLLAALARCIVQSLRYHARRAGVDLVAEASASGVVAKRAEDERYAFVEIDVDVAVELDPTPDALPELLAKAERDCFVAASLRVKPTYRWTVNGAAVALDNVAA